MIFDIQSFVRKPYLIIILLFYYQCNWYLFVDFQLHCIHKILEKYINFHNFIL